VNTQIPNCVSSLVKEEKTLETTKTFMLNNLTVLGVCVGAGVVVLVVIGVVVLVIKRKDNEFILTMKEPLYKEMEEK